MKPVLKTIAIALALLLATAPTVTLADDAKPPTPAETKGLNYLLTRQDPKSGGWLTMVGPAITALVTKAMIQSGKPLDDPALQKALASIESFHQKDGGYYKNGQPNYNTSIVLSLFAVLPQDQYKDKIKGAQDFLRASQQIEGKKDSTGKEITKDNPWYGGSGYGEDRPDLSNTAFFIQALHDTGVSPSDPALQKALVFVTRSQLNGATNDQEFAKGSDDGGFIYSPVGDEKSKMGDVDNLEGGSVLRTYGSMTYSGIKSMIYCGVGRDDPRMKAAVKWIQNMWTLEDNPGTGGAMGLYYYYHTFAKAMNAYGQNTITDSKGATHDWRKEINDQLAKSQNDDGSWVNKKSDRWFENNPVLVTAYSVLALQEARK